jgi:hypothetical protein
MHATSAKRAFLNYVRAEGDEADVIRLSQAAFARGLLITPLEAMVIWEWYSERFYAAGWMTMDDHGAQAALDRFLAAYGEDGDAP